jgi:hypothetical protein
MKRLLIVSLQFCLISEAAAQQNWAAVPCSNVSGPTQFERMWVDSLHNEIILYSIWGFSVCNTNYRGIVAYNGSDFHNLDFGISTHRSGTSAAGDYVKGLITYGDKTLFGGGFLTVGSDTLKSKSLALWNGTKWDTFPKPVFRNDMNGNSGGGFFGFLKYNGKLWMYGAFDTIGGVVTKNLAAFDGNTFASVPAIPVNNPSPITEAIWYKNKLVVSGSFYDYPSFSFYRLAQFDGTSWSQVGGGLRGSLSACQTIAVYKDTLYIGGAFPQAAGNAGNYLMKWDGSQLSDAGFSDTFCGYGAIWKLLVFRNRLYAFGGFSCVSGQKAFGVAYYENGKWTVPKDSIEGNGIFDAVVYNDCIYIGGSFESINGDASIQKFAKLICPDFDATTGCISGLKEAQYKIDAKVFPNPSKNKIQIEFEQNIGIDKVSITNTLGQVLFVLFKPVPKQEIDLSHLPAGIYFLKVENKQAQGVFKVVKE